MGSIPYALSINHYITTVGSDAGFAALIGLAILVLLYFAQARETSSLREQVDQSTEHVQHLEARLASVMGGEASATGPQAAARAPGSPGESVPDESDVATAARFSASAPACALASAPAPGSAPALRFPGAPAPGSPAAPPALEPAAPAGVAAPALAAATRLIPSPVGAASVPATPRPVTAAATAVTGRPIEDTAITAFVPAPSPPGSNGVNPTSVPAAGTHGAGTAPPAPPPRVQTRSAGAAPTGPSTAAPTGGGSRSASSIGGGRALVAILAGLLVVGVVVGLVAVTSSGGSSGNSPAGGKTSASSTAAARGRGRSVVVNPRTVRIAVLNGTATAGLARRIAMKLDGGGYNVTATTNAADQTRTSTIVAFTPGQRQAALAVAQSLGVRSGLVQPIDQSTQAIACPPPQPCTTTVVVTAGADLSSSA